MLSGSNVYILVIGGTLSGSNVFILVIGGMLSVSNIFTNSHLIQTRCVDMYDISSRIDPYCPHIKGIARGTYYTTVSITLSYPLSIFLLMREHVSYISAVLLDAVES
jgi:hypothetical protein